MSRMANPYDNARAESFRKTLKHEEVLACNYETVQDVVDRVPRFIEEIYKCRRLRSAFGYLPPEEFEITQTACAGYVKAGPDPCPTRGLHCIATNVLISDVFGEQSSQRK